MSSSSSSSSWKQLKLLIGRKKNQPTATVTENNLPTITICKFPVMLFGISFLFCFISFILCILAELLRNKEDDIRWNGSRLCHAAESPSYWVGMAALCCLALSQLLANFIFFSHSSKIAQFSNIPLLPKLLLLISWVCCVVGIVILGVAISMSRDQNYGEGWLDGDCYVVKPGCFVGSSILLILSLASISTSSFSTIRIHPH